MAKKSRENEPAVKTCSSCNSEISEGLNCLQLQNGVIGYTGFVNLTTALYFCEAGCLESWLGRTRSGFKMPRRVP